MSIPNPVYDDVDYDEVENFNDDEAEIQAAPAAAATTATPPPIFNGQRFAPPPPPPADPNQHNYGALPFRPTQQDPRRQFGSRDAPGRHNFTGRASPPAVFDRDAYCIPEPDRRSSISHKTPLQPHHFEKLMKASQFPTWEKRVKSAISSIPGYGDQLLNFGVTPDTIIREQILNFLIQTVYDTEGFDKINTIEGTDYNGCSTRGRDAWQALRDHYYQVGSARISELLADFNRPQQPHESGSTFITRVINKRLEIRQAGTEVPHDHARSLMMDGLR
jgi:hypothetical protein